MRIEALLAYARDYAIVQRDGDDAPPELRTRVIAVSVRARAELG